jgi:circadian clock protein KaiC
MSAPESLFPKAGTGVEGLDDILGGGFPRDRLYLVEGGSGSGKTTLALQFLLEGARQGERGLYVTLSETEEELRGVAASHGWSLDGLTICDLAGSEESLKADAQYTVFHPSEVEFGETTQAVLDEVERVQPARVVLDSLSEVRLLARDPVRYRRQMLALKQFFIGRQCTVLLLDDRLTESDLQLHCLTHGTLELEQLAPAYGGQRRRLRVVKLRGVRFRSGYHDFSITTGGLVAYPRLIAAEHHQPFVREPLSSGVPALDSLMGGGLDRGSSVLILGAAGTGKSTLAAQFATTAARRDEQAALYIFEESPESLFARTAGLGIDLAGHAAAGCITARRVNPAELSPGEFTHLVRQSVERDHAQVIVIDSLNGYLSAMPEERSLATQLHEMLAYLGHHGVLSLLVMSQYGLLGGGLESPVDVSSLADAVLLLRYFEMSGEVRRAISLVKKRSGYHERTIRELRIEPTGISVSEPLREFHGVLTGLPVYHRHVQPLRGSSDDADTV